MKALGLAEEHPHESCLSFVTGVSFNPQWTELVAGYMVSSSFTFQVPVFPHMVLSKDEILRLIAVCHWHLYAACYTMDHADLILSQPEAQEMPWAPKTWDKSI